MRGQWTERNRHLTDGPRTEDGRKRVSQGCLQRKPFPRILELPPQSEEQLGVRRSWQDSGKDEIGAKRHQNVPRSPCGSVWEMILAYFPGNARTVGIVCVSLFGAWIGWGVTRRPRTLLWIGIRRVFRKNRTPPPAFRDAEEGVTDDEEGVPDFDKSKKE